MCYTVGSFFSVSLHATFPLPLPVNLNIFLHAAEACRWFPFRFGTMSYFVSMFCHYKQNRDVQIQFSSNSCTFKGQNYNEMQLCAACVAVLISHFLTMAIFFFVVVKYYVMQCSYKSSRHDSVLLLSCHIPKDVFLICCCLIYLHNFP